ncbi:MAG: efflux RND transporter periplasmic adaptor subunit [Bacteroidales bacterium]
MNKKILIGLGALVVIILIIIFSTSGKKGVAPQKVSVNKGYFEVLVTITGELQAKNKEDITAPPELRRSRSFRFSEIKIQDLIPEGSLVDSGDYVATLDRSALSNRLKEIEDELDKSQQQYLKTELDTTLQLRSLRDELINLEFELEERQIVLDQSKFEPPATQRQAKISLERAERNFQQAKHNYKLKREQAEASMREVAINLARQERERQDMLDVLSKFVVSAPKSGMVIYHREWSGQKRTVGSSVSPWDLTVATLPDLSVMISKTYVNEIDVSKLKVNQDVRIGVDAFPDKDYTGVVTQVANIGEQLPNTDAKVFEVTIRVNEYDPILRPSMTTSNQIIIRSFDDVLYVPLEAIHPEDSISYVYTTRNRKQVVITGHQNENFIIVEKGLNENDEIYLSVPENPDKFALAGEELIPEIMERAAEPKRKEEQSRVTDQNPNGKQSPRGKPRG